MYSKMEIIKIVDKQGRVVLPKKWRQKYAKKGRVILRIEGERIIIEPFKLPNLTEFFDSVEVEIKSDLSDWKSVRRELLETH
ncbi:MAG: AbrB/MazE/SpoVT family DNA-binding domain-containing protein [Thermoproteales archaeon]|nr:AbrB/MazE/SpoVT family DNA-binding domain-containing protein [Thermoproteales archaeon]